MRSEREAAALCSGLSTGGPSALAAVVGLVELAGVGVVVRAVVRELGAVVDGLDVGGAFEEAVVFEAGLFARGFAVEDEGGERGEREDGEGEEGDEVGGAEPSGLGAGDEDPGERGGAGDRGDGERHHRHAAKRPSHRSHATRSPNKTPRGTHPHDGRTP